MKIDDALIDRLAKLSSLQIAADKKENLKSGQVARQIGNAVPPKLGEVIGLSIIKHLKEVEENEKKD